MLNLQFTDHIRRPGMFFIINNPEHTVGAHIFGRLSVLKNNLAKY